MTAVTRSYLPASDATSSVSTNVWAPIAKSRAALWVILNRSQIATPTKMKRVKSSRLKPEVKWRTKPMMPSSRVSCTISPTSFSA